MHIYYYFVYAYSIFNVYIPSLPTATPWYDPEILSSYIVLSASLSSAILSFLSGPTFLRPFSKTDSMQPYPSHAGSVCPVRDSRGGLNIVKHYPLYRQIKKSLKASLIQSKYS